MPNAQKGEAMKGIPLRRRGAVVCASIAGAAICVVTVTGAARGSTGSHPTHTSSSVSAAVHTFARNAAGLTYGSELDASSPGDAPDLIAAYATDGKLGYVRKVDLHPALPEGPSAALSAQRTATNTTVIPVYALDGKTVIGEFEIAPPNGQ
jgi:hypothetical protein